jgi:hypothetical protein
MRLFIVTVVAFGVVCAAAIEVGDECPPLNRPEVVTDSGGYGANVNVDDYLAANKTFLVAFGSDS